FILNSPSKIYLRFLTSHLYFLYLLLALTFFAFWALHKPDNYPAYIFHKGWISIRLEDKVKDANTVSIWAGDGGRPYSRIKVYVSKNGRHWTQINNIKVTRWGIAEYNTTGNFGDVRYIKIEHKGGRWSYIRLDAVCAKGGES
ncbi:MAG: hypothetical protein P8105_13525, partial [Dehalococcoidia bacterium]